MDFAPGSVFPRHKHPGEEPFVPEGVVHAARNPGSEPAAELATYVLEKGKPLVVLAD